MEEEKNMCFFYRKLKKWALSAWAWYIFFLLLEFRDNLGNILQV